MQVVERGTCNVTKHFYQVSGLQKGSSMERKQDFKKKKAVHQDSRSSRMKVIEEILLMHGVAYCWIKLL